MTSKQWALKSRKQVRGLIVFEGYSLVTSTYILRLFFVACVNHSILSQTQLFQSKWLIMKLKGPLISKYSIIVTTCKHKKQFQHTRYKNWNTMSCIFSWAAHWFCMWYKIIQSGSAFGAMYTTHPWIMLVYTTSRADVQRHLQGIVVAVAFPDPTCKCVQCTGV